MKVVPPSIDKVAFSCPHCHVLASQTWFTLYARLNDKENPVPFCPKETSDFSHITDVNLRRELIEFEAKIIEGNPFLKKLQSAPYISIEVHNIFISKCFSCKKLAVWQNRSLMYPKFSDVPAANPDIPEEIRRDYEEAGHVLKHSPRSAAALLRLVIQKLCKTLGESGNNLNSDIGSLVKKGLDSKVQKALDVVRVIGNNAVHPGTIDIRDDTETARILFDLVNIIVDKTISEKRKIEEIYSVLSPDQLEAIRKRDEKS